MRLRSGGRSRNAAAAIVWALALLVVVAVGVALVTAFLRPRSSSCSRRSSRHRHVQADLASLGISPLVAEALRDLLAIIRSVFGLETGSSRRRDRNAAAGIVTVMVLSTFLRVLLPPRWRSGVALGVPGGGAIRSATDHDAGEDALTRLGGYLRGTTILAAIIATTDLVFMLLLGVPSAVPLLDPRPSWAATSRTSAASSRPRSSFVVTSRGAGWRRGAGAARPDRRAQRRSWAIGIRPALYGRTVSIHPALVLLVLPAGFQLAGVIGLFIAVPVSAVVFAVGRAIARHRRAGRHPRPARDGPRVARPPRAVELADPRRRSCSSRSSSSSSCTIPLVLLPIVLSRDPRRDRSRRSSRGSSSAVGHARGPSPIAVGGESLRGRG